MTPEEKALSLFRQPPRCLNCAQTICAAMDREDMVDGMQDKARGSAPGGTCGALYAAMSLSPDRAEATRAAFTAALGANTCAELKALHIPCPRCVQTAITLLAADRTRSV